jgi:hypothetical protein
MTLAMASRRHTSLLAARQAAWTCTPALPRSPADAARLPASTRSRNWCPLPADGCVGWLLPRGGRRTRAATVGNGHRPIADPLPRPRQRVARLQCLQPLPVRHPRLCRGAPRPGHRRDRGCKWRDASVFRPRTRGVTAACRGGALPPLRHSVGIALARHVPWLVISKSPPAAWTGLEAPPQSYASRPRAGAAFWQTARISSCSACSSSNEPVMLARSDACGAPDFSALPMLLSRSGSRDDQRPASASNAADCAASALCLAGRPAGTADQILPGP